MKPGAWHRVNLPWWTASSESRSRQTRLTTRLCPKCGKWVPKKTKRHGCDVAPSPKKWRWCTECLTYVRIAVRHKCDRAPVIPDDVPEKECRACGETWPLTRDFWNTRGKDGGWRPECRECRNGRRRQLKAGAPRVKPWGGARSRWHTTRKKHPT